MILRPVRTDRPAASAGGALEVVSYSHRRPISVGVDLTNGGALVPLCAVTPGGGLFAEAVLAVGSGPGDVDAGFLSPGTEAELVDRLRVAAAARATLAVRRDALVAAFLAGCGRADADPRILTIEVPVRRVVGEAGTAGEGRLAIRVTAVRRPAPPHVAIIGSTARLEDETRPDRVPLATLQLGFGPDVVLAPPDYRLPVAVGVEAIAPAALGLRLEAAPGAAVLVPVSDSRDDNRASANLRITDPSALARGGSCRIVVEADPAAVFAAVTAAAGTRRALEVRADIGARAGGDGRVVATGEGEVAATASVEVEARPIVSVDAGGGARRILLAEAGAVELDPVGAVVRADEGGGADRVDLPGRLAVRAPLRARVERVRAVAVVAAADGTAISGPETTLRPDRRAGVAEALFDLAHLAPLGALADGLGARDHVRVDVAIAITVDAPGGVGTATITVRLPVDVRRASEDLPVCIDFGASAIGVWVGRPDAAGARTRLSRLPLGRWHEAVDPAHDESSLVTGDHDGYLIPSQIGLSSRHNLRAAYDPARLGDLTLALGDEAAVARRLERLGRRYDVSIPFPNAAALHDHLGEVVLDLKRRLTTDARTIPLDRPVAQRDRAGGRIRHDDRVDVPALFADSVDEILKLYVARAVAHRFDGDPDRPIPRPRLVLTHPSGVGSEQVERYRRAAAPLVADRAAAPEHDGARDVVLYPEAVAAARFALDQPEFAAVHGRDADDRPHVLVALDVGAGTFDVAIVAVGAGMRPPAVDAVLATFGVPLGGNQLDRAIAARLAAGLSSALGGDGLPAEPLPGLGGPVASGAGGPDRVAGDRARRLAWFERQIRVAKIRLADALLAADTGSYRWPAERALDVLVHDGDAEIGVVRPTRRASEVRAVGDMRLPDLGVLRTEMRRAGAGVRAVRLAVPGAVFDGPAPAGTPAAHDPHRIVRVLGSVLPAIALDAARGLAPTARLTVMVTGRTVLWPPLFAAIAETVAAHPAGARLVAGRPFDAARMKRAVVAGAMMLAEERGYAPVEAVHPNPLAAVGLVVRSGDVPGGQGLDIALRAAAITYLAPFGAVGGPGERLVAAGDVRLARAIPYLDADRLAAIDAVMPDGALFLELRRPDGGLLGNLSQGGGTRLSVVGSATDGTVVVTAAGRDRTAPGREIAIRGDTATSVPSGRIPA